MRGCFEKTTHFMGGLRAEEESPFIENHYSAARGEHSADEDLKSGKTSRKKNFQCVLKF